jgi:hypothetical protein
MTVPSVVQSVASELASLTKASEGHRSGGESLQGKRDSGGFEIANFEEDASRRSQVNTAASASSSSSEATGAAVVVPLETLARRETGAVPSTGGDVFYSPPLVAAQRDVPPPSTQNGMTSSSSSSSSSAVVRVQPIATSSSSSSSSSFFSSTVPNDDLPDIANMLKEIESLKIKLQTKDGEVLFWKKRDNEVCVELRLCPLLDTLFLSIPHHLLSYECSDHHNPCVPHFLPEINNY